MPTLDAATLRMKAINFDWRLELGYKKATRLPSAVFGARQRVRMLKVAGDLADQLKRRFKLKKPVRQALVFEKLFKIVWRQCPHCQRM